MLEDFTTNTEFPSLLPAEIFPESSKEVEHWMLGSHDLNLNGLSLNPVSNNNNRGNDPFLLHKDFID